MVVITDIKVGADDFRLERLFESFPNISIEVERVILTNKGVMPLFWIAGTDSQAVAESLQADSVVKTVQITTPVIAVASSSTRSQRSRGFASNSGISRGRYTSVSAVVLADSQRTGRATSTSISSNEKYFRPLLCLPTE